MTASTLARTRRSAVLVLTAVAALTVACSSPAADNAASTTAGATTSSAATTTSSSAADIGSSSSAADTASSSSGSSDTTSAGSTPSSATSSSAPLEDTLVIASWGGRFTAATKKYLADPFAAETGIKVQIVDVPGTQAAQLQAQKDAGNVQWDVLDSLGASDAFYMNQQGLLEQLPANMKSAFDKTLGESRVSDFGYTFANLGYIIICNNATVPTCPKTVPEFFDTEKFPGKRELPGSSPSQMTAILAQAAGNPVDKALPIDIDKMLAPLQAIKPSVSVFYTSGDQQEQSIRQGEADMGIIYSGRAYNVAKTTDVTIDWAGAYDPGYTAIAKGAPHPSAAAAFLNWVANHADAQAKWSQEMQYSVPNPKALQLLPANVAKTLADYPENFDKLAQQDFEWYLKNKKQIDNGLQQIIQGS